MAGRSYNQIRYSNSAVNAYNQIASYRIPSRTVADKAYTVYLDPDRCSCDEFVRAGGTCAHVVTARFVRRTGRLPRPATTEWVYDMVLQLAIEIPIGTFDSSRHER
jgi:hypothetical protein